MAELVPILGGVLTGFVIGARLRGRPVRLVWMVATSVAIGTLAALVSGELAESPVFLAIDIPGTFVAEAVAIFTVDRLGWGAVGERPPK